MRATVQTGAAGILEAVLALTLLGNGCGGAALCAEDWAWTPPDLPAVALSAGAPTIDGALDDPAWANASRSDAFLLTDARAAKSHTRVLVMRDDATLYVGVECFEAPERLTALAAQAAVASTDPLWSDDCVELFFDPSNQRTSFFQIIASYRNTTWCAFHAAVGGREADWPQTYAVASKIGAASWATELAIPLAAFPGRSAPAWAFNVSRTRKAADELVYWSPVFNPSSHAPETFGTLSGMPER